MTSAKGRKTYEREIASLQKANTKLSNSLRATVSDLVRIVEAPLWRAIPILIKYRKSYKAIKKNQTQDNA